MSEEKTYTVKKYGDGKSPHLLVSAEDAGDILPLCSCGRSMDPDRKCDGSHLKEQESEGESVSGGGCCGGGCGS